MRTHSVIDHSESLNIYWVFAPGDTSGVPFRDRDSAERYAREAEDLHREYR